MNDEDKHPAYLSVNISREAGKQPSYNATADASDIEAVKEALESVDRWFTEKFSPQYRQGAQDRR